MVMTHSYSSLKLYENCPKRYYHQRVAKDVKDEAGEASIYGERIHKLLEDRLRNTEDDVPKEIERYEPLCQSVLRLAEGKELLVEQELTLTNKLAPTGWWDDDAWLRSKLDVLILDGKTGRAVVMDWKTGKRRPDFFQLELFALQVFKHYPGVRSVTSSFVWLKDMATDKEVYKYTSAPDLWTKFFQKVERIERSLEDKNWPAKPSGLCGYCPVPTSKCEFRR